MTQTAIEVVGLNKWYGSFHALKDLSLSVDIGEKLVICGPSGSGSSTFIRCMNQASIIKPAQCAFLARKLTNILAHSTV